MLVEIETVASVSETSSFRQWTKIRGGDIRLSMSESNMLS